MINLSPLYLYYTIFKLKIMTVDSLDIFGKIKMSLLSFGAHRSKKHFILQKRQHATKTILK